MNATATSSKQQAQRHFSHVAVEWASYYDDPDPPPSRRYLFARQRLALDMVQAVSSPSSRILDAGCGSGVLAAKLRDQGFAVWGLDFAEPMIRKARELCGSRPFTVGDIEHLPFPDDAFDVVVSLAVIEYLDSDESALREIRRVLKPGGRAVIAIANGGSPLLWLDDALVNVSSALRPISRVLRNVIPGQRGGVDATPRSGVRRQPRRRFYRRRWLRVLRDANFEVEEWICHGWGWLRSPLGRLVRALSGKDSLRAVDPFARNRALNWLGAEHLFRVRAIK